MRMTPGHSSGPQDTPLFHLVFQRISESPEGSVPFSDWMDLVLYHSEWGYYSRRGVAPGFREVGRGGDFFTSVSIGETYGLLLAHRITRIWETDFGRALPFVLVFGALPDSRASPHESWRAAMKGRLLQKSESSGTQSACRGSRCQERLPGQGSTGASSVSG